MNRIYLFYLPELLREKEEVKFIIICVFSVKKDFTFKEINFSFVNSVAIIRNFNITIKISVDYCYQHVYKS